MIKKLCSIDGCIEPMRALELCQKHYKSFDRKRNPQKHKDRDAAARAVNPRRSAVWYSTNKEKALASAAQWRAENKNKVRAYQDARDPFAERLRASAYRDRNPGKVNALNARRRAKKIKATAAWANLFFIEEIYDLARLRTKHLGVKHHVDHIVPLQHPLVCGLHVEHNLQVIPAFDNLSKKNRWWPDMPMEMPQ